MKKGLSFVPSGSFDVFSYVKDLHLFVRKLQWHKFHRIQDKKASREWGVPLEIVGDMRNLFSLIDDNERASGTGPFTDLKIKSSTMPPSMESNCADAFLAKMIRDLENFQITPWASNHSEEEWAALKNLEKDHQITIKPSDKGGNIVVMDTDAYISMCEKLLRDKTTYEILSSDPTVQYKEELKTILVQAKNDQLISPAEMDFMLPTYPIRACFYALPKLHKGTSPLKGRPIVAGIGSLTQNVGIYVDRILAPFVTSLNSYVKDTTDFFVKNRKYNS